MPQSCCSRDCQKADWKTHKNNYAKNASETFAQGAGTSQNSTNAANPPKNLSAAVDKPFHRLESKTWLHDRPEKDVYQLLILSSVYGGQLQFRGRL